MPRNDTPRPLRLNAPRLNANFLAQSLDTLAAASYHPFVRQFFGCSKVPADAVSTTKMDEYENLSRRERQIMDAIYGHGEATATQVIHDMADPPSRTAVRTLLRILVEKQMLSQRKRGRELVYKPTRPRRRAGQSALNRVVHTFFDGSLEQAVAAHLGGNHADLSDEELKRLAALIRDARKKGN